MKRFIAIAAMVVIAAALAYGSSATAAPGHFFDNGYNTRQVIKFGNMGRHVDIRQRIRRYAESPRAPGPLQAGGIGQVGTTVGIVGGGLGRVGNNVSADSDTKTPARAR